MHLAMNFTTTPIVVLLAVCLALDGCATSAVISHSDGPVLQGKIDHSDDTALYVIANDDQRFRVERSGVVDIRHPVNGTAAVVMLAAAALGLVAFVAIAPSNDPIRCGQVQDSSQYRASWL